MSEEERIIDRVMMIDQWKTSGDIYTQDELNAIGMLLDLYYKQQKEIEKYKQITNMYDSYKCDTDNKIILADKEYFDCGMFKEKYISKDKIKELIENNEENIDYSIHDIIEDLKELLGEEK